MQWFDERWFALKDAKGHQILLYAAAAALVVAAWDGLWPSLEKSILGGIIEPSKDGKPMAIVGAPVWAMALALSGYLFAVWLLEYAVKLRRELAPKLSLSFDSGGGSIVETPEKKRDQAGNAVKEWRAIYVRIAVDAESKRSVRQCAGNCSTPG